MTSSAVTAVPSWNFASGRSVYATHDRSAGVSMVSAIWPYSENGSSNDWMVSVSKIWPIDAAALPFRMNGFRLSNVPIAASLTSPPFGAFGLTYSKCLKPGPYLRSPYIESAWPDVAFGWAPGRESVVVRVAASTRSAATISQ